MKIDNRIFLPFAGPFVFLGFLRLLWWVAGANWDPNIAAPFAMASGVIGGVLAAGLLFECGISLGHTTIGKRRDDDNETD